MDDTTIMILIVVLMYVMMTKSCKQKEKFISIIVPRHSRYSVFNKGYKVRSSRGVNIKYMKNLYLNKRKIY